MKKNNKLYGIWVFDKKLKDDFYPLISAGNCIEHGRAFIYRHKDQAKRAIRELKPVMKFVELEIREVKI
jgi:hypothetical protein